MTIDSPYMHLSVKVYVRFQGGILIILGAARRYTIDAFIFPSNRRAFSSSLSH